MVKYEIVLLFCYKILGNGRTTAATNNVPLLIENLKIIAINPSGTRYKRETLVLILEDL
jgi:hypothetical protein